MSNEITPTQQTQLRPPVSQVPAGAPVTFAAVLEKMVLSGYSADPKEFKAGESGVGSLGFYGNSKVEVGGMRLQVMCTVTVVKSKEMTAAERASVKQRIGLLR